MGLSYEQKMRMLKWAKPDKKDILFAKLAKGEKVDVTQDEDLFFSVNRDRASMDSQVNREKYRPIVEHVKNSRDIMKNGKKLRYKGEIPLDLWLTHPWFSPNLSKEERDANINKFFRMFPAFSAKGF